MSPDTKRVLRTALQIIAGLAFALPFLVHTANLPATLPGLGVALTVAGLVTKAMAQWNDLLPAWLQVEAPPAWAIATAAACDCQHTSPRHAAVTEAPAPAAPTSEQVYAPATQPSASTAPVVDEEPPDGEHAPTAP